MAKNDALIKLTDARIDDNNKLATFIEQAKAITIPLFPETVQFTDPALKYSATVVTVDTTLDNYNNNRDIYKNESGTYCLHLTKLNEIAQAAGVQIIDSRPIERKFDEQGRVTFICHQIRFRMKSIDGSVKEIVVTGKYDYFRDCEKFMKPGEKDKYGKPKGLGQVNARRSHADALAESNALTRGYNKMIGKLPSSFTLDELKKPFLIPCVIEDKDALLSELPEADRLAIRKKLIEKRLGVADLIYGTPEQVESMSKEKPPAENAQIEILPDEDEPEQESQSKPQVDIEQEIGIKCGDFQCFEQSERTRLILSLIDKTGWTRPGTNGKITEVGIAKTPLTRQVEVYKELLHLEAKQAEEVAL